jgi:hypothetical protein
VADVLEQHIMDIGRRYFLKHLHTYQAPDLQVRLFITYNSVIFTLVRFISQDRALLNEDEVVNGLATMVTATCRAQLCRRDSACRLTNKAASMPLSTQLLKTLADAGQPFWVAIVVQ